MMAPLTSHWNKSSIRPIILRTKSWGYHLFKKGGAVTWIFGITFIMVGFPLVMQVRYLSASASSSSVLALVLLFIGEQRTTVDGTGEAATAARLWPSATDRNDPCEVKRYYRTVLQPLDR